MSWVSALSQIVELHQTRLPSETQMQSVLECVIYVLLRPQGRVMLTDDM